MEMKSQGIRMSLKIESKEDLDRYVVTTDYTSIKILDLDFEIPSKSQPSQITTIEGILSKTITNLSEQKNVIENTNPELALKMNVVIDGLIAIRNLSRPLLMVTVIKLL